MDLLNSLLNFGEALLQLAASLFGAVAPWAPLLGWIAFWLLAVDWTVLLPLLLRRGAIVGVALLFVMPILIWGVVAPPPDGVHYLFGLALGNFTGKLVYVTTLTVIAWMCGAVQLSGACASLLRFDPPVALAEAHDAHAGHDNHGHGHGHDAHGH
ncbi:MAG: hypothetical protein KF774_08820 [Planctomyces sp.]|nr:hypothetical protein [Planctomyces sp.]